MLDLIPRDSPRTIVHAAKEQDLLGAYLFIEGRITKGWGAAQQLYYDDEYPKLRRTGVSWSAMVVRNILRYCREHWLGRNQYVQDNQINQSQEKLKRNILRALESEYEKGVEGILLNERFLFDIDLSQLKKLSMNAQRAWIDHVYTARHFYGERTANERASMQRFMKRWRAPRRRRRASRM